MKRPQISKAELKAAQGFGQFINAGAAKHGVDPAVVAGVGSRESGWGTGSDMKPPGPGGTGDWKPRREKPPLRGPMPPDGLGYGRGLVQADWDWSEFSRTGAWADPAANIGFGCTELSSDIKEFERRGLAAADAQRAGIAAYNHGVAGVWADIQHGGMAAVDAGTAHGNYSADVLSRAEFYRKHGFATNVASDLLAVEIDAAVTAPIVWPAEGSPQLNAFFGPIEVDDNGMLKPGWEERHLTLITCPWTSTLSWDQSKTTQKIRCNKKVATSLTQIPVENLGRLWE